ncbi:MAG: hypothetical protein Q9165_001200 [Trypethelium subeluteriae]
MFHPTFSLCSGKPLKWPIPPITTPEPYLPYQKQSQRSPEPLNSTAVPSRTPVNQFLSPRRRWYLIGSGVVLFAMGFYTTSLYSSLSRSPPPTSSASSNLSHPGSPSRQSDFTSIYDTTARTYDSLVSTSEFLMGMSLLRRSLARRARGDVLEASCGTGRNLKWLPWGKVRSLTCVDASREMIGVAREKAEWLEDGRRAKVRWVVGGLGRGVPRAPSSQGEGGERVEKGTNGGKDKESETVQIREDGAKEGNGEDGVERERDGEEVKDTQKMSLIGRGAQDVEGKYDTIIQSLGLCSTDQPVQLIRGLARAAKSDGEVVLLEHGKSHYEWLNAILDRTAPDHARMHGCWWNRDIGKLVEESGLEVVKIWRCHFGTTWWVELRPPSTELVDKWDREEAKAERPENMKQVVTKRAKWWSWKG